MRQLLLINALVILVYMTGWFVAARVRNRLDTVDNAWAGGYFCMAWAVVIARPHWINLLIAGLITIWAARLTWHIASRNSKKPEDPRYVEISRKWKGNLWLRAYFSIFILQGLLIWIIGLPISVAGSSSQHQLGYALIGVAVWLAGYIIEYFGDKQLKDYLASKPDKSQVLDSGLWHYSRHPNYFGEITQWYGIAIVALSAHHGWLGLIGPTVLYVTIRYASGVPPIENKRRDNPAYQAYARRTSVLLPLPPRTK